MTVSQRMGHEDTAMIRRYYARLAHQTASLRTRRTGLGVKVAAPS